MVETMRENPKSSWLQRWTKPLMPLALVGALSAVAVATAPQPAEAFRGRGAGIAAGIIAGAVIGGYAYGYPRAYAYEGCYAGPRICRRVGGYCDTNRYGDTYCRGGVVRCYRERVCD